MTTVDLVLIAAGIFLIAFSVIALRRSRYQQKLRLFLINTAILYTFGSIYNSLGLFEHFWSLDIWVWIAMALIPLFVYIVAYPRKI